MLDITAVNGELELSEVAQQKLLKFRDMQIQMAEMKQLEGEIKESLIKAMEKNGIKKFESDYVTFTYVPESTRKTADTAKMKEDNIFDEYCKESVVKPSVRITFKDGD